MKSSINNWKELNKIVLTILSVDSIFTKNVEKILVHCCFENIAKGRCLINLEIKNNDNKDEILIFSDKALINVNIFYSSEKIKKILISLSNKTNRKKRVIIYPKKGIFINENGYLFVKEKTKLEIQDIEWTIPFI